MFSAAWGPGGLRLWQHGLRTLRGSKRTGTRAHASSSSSSAPSQSAGVRPPAACTPPAARPLPAHLRAALAPPLTSCAAEPLQSVLGNAVVRAGLISGSLSLAGDLAAQLAVNWGQPSAPYDAARAARMGTFGLFLYGPYQHYWYSALDRAMPARTLANFALKVGMNQALLAPLVVGGVFAWNLALQGRLGEWGDKVRADFGRTIVTGWKFWVPAATVNFAAVPLRHQVLYLSTCGLLWTAFLSYSSATTGQQAAAQPAAKGKGKR